MVGGSLRVLRLLPPLKLVTMIYSYSWNIAESGIKHNKSINHLKNATCILWEQWNKTQIKYYFCPYLTPLQKSVNIRRKQTKIIQIRPKILSIKIIQKCNWFFSIIIFGSLTPSFIIVCRVRGYGVQQYSSYIVAVNFIGRVNWHTRTEANHRSVTSHWQTLSHIVV
jgi:hypothetical protein